MFCKQCGIPAVEAGPFSRAGLCDVCGVVNKVANDMQLHEHNGPYFEHWRRRTLAAFGVTVVDDAPASG